MKKTIEILEKAIADLKAIKESLNQPYIVGEYYYFSNYEPFNKQHQVIYGKLQEIKGSEYKCNGLWFQLISEHPLKRDYSWI